MPLLNQSAFLQALGQAIASSLWQMAILWILYQFFTGMNKKTTAFAKNLIATSLLFTGCGWFVYELASKYVALQNEVILVLQDNKLQSKDAWQFVNASKNSFYSSINTFLLSAEKYLPYISTAYLLILCFLFIRLLYSWYYSQIIKTKGLKSIDNSWTEHFNHLVEQAEIKRKITLWLSEKIDVPATVGFFKPIILLPIASLNQLTTEQVETILLHELGHVKRNDYIINLFVAITETILFFNPFAVLLSKHLKKERENCCDDFVLRLRNQPETYAGALLVLEQTRIQTQSLLLKATGNDGQLLNRIKRIMNVPIKQFNYSQKLLAFIITAGILASLAWMKPVSREQQSIPNNTPENKITSSINSKKIILTPSSIEKRPNGNLILFDEKKNNSLLVKVEKDKIMLIDELNNTKIEADELTLEKSKQFDKSIEKLEDIEILMPKIETSGDEIPEQPELANKKLLIPHTPFQIGFPAIRMQPLKIPIIRDQHFRRKKMKNDTVVFNLADLALKEWENLPTGKDWEKLYEEINRMQEEIKRTSEMNATMERINLQMQALPLKLTQSDSLLIFDKILQPALHVNFNGKALIEQKEIQLKTFLLMKSLMLTRFKKDIPEKSIDYIFVYPDADMNLIINNEQRCEEKNSNKNFQWDIELPPPPAKKIIAEKSLSKKPYKVVVSL
ncbi:MAG TPA: M56 family metallopeptidase [Chitinophagaceae bacterium]|nr:M56 family metallopeptidase [Chitinophagaceae bacterium]